MHITLQHACCNIWNIIYDAIVHLQHGACCIVFQNQLAEQIYRTRILLLPCWSRDRSGGISESWVFWCDPFLLGSSVCKKWAFDLCQDVVLAWMLCSMTSDSLRFEISGEERLQRWLVIKNWHTFYLIWWNYSRYNCRLRWAEASVAQFYAEAAKIVQKHLHPEAILAPRPANIPKNHRSLLFLFQQWSEVSSVASLRSSTHAGTWNAGPWKLCKMHLVVLDQNASKPSKAISDIDNWNDLFVFLFISGLFGGSWKHLVGLPPLPVHG